MASTVLSPVYEQPPKSSLLSLADPIPSNIDWTSGVVMVDQPAAHALISRRSTPTPDITGNEEDLCADGNIFRPFAIDWYTQLKGLAAATGPAESTARALAEHSLTADVAYSISRALQFGVQDGTYGDTPGFMSLAVGTGAGQVPMITTAGAEATISGAGLSITRAVGELLDWWRVNGLPGMCVLHMPTKLIPFAASAGLVDFGAQGPLMLAGGTAWLSFGPGYDPDSGPDNESAPDDTAFMWVSSRIYAAYETESTITARKNFRNESMTQARRKAILAFNTSTVASALVDLN